MTTIPDTMKNISRDIQQTFEELIKLLLRKSLRPVLNPLNANTKIVYNNFLGKYERGFVGSSPDNNINKYNYIMTQESLGWNDEVLTNFKAVAKFIKNNTVQRFPMSSTLTHNTIKSKTRAKVAFTDKEAKFHSSTGRIPPLTQYKNSLAFITSRNMQGVVSNRQANFFYNSNVPYTHAFKQLESIGKDIIDQTDPSISGYDSAKMSTSMLRVKLYNLEQALANLSVEYPYIYDAYIEMIRLINSAPKIKNNWVINLIALLSYQRWEDLSPEQQQVYLDNLGSDFIDIFNSNELITILLQGDASELILTCAYLYSLLKMLFIVFGYSKLIPVIVEGCYDAGYQNKYQKHLNKYRGGSLRRGELNSTTISCQANPTKGALGSASCSSLNNVNQTTISSDSSSSVVSRPKPEPIDPCVYDFIRLFGDLYPTLIGLMGGTEEFPPELIEMRCEDIPNNYISLVSLPEYLWRFNDYSYCKYLEYIGSKQLTTALCSKVNSKIRYLRTF